MTGKTRLALVAVCVSAVAGAVENPYGICAHLHAADAKSREMTLKRMTDAGIGWFRTDFVWEQIEKRPGEYDFSVYDAVMDEARGRGVKVLPILDYDNPKVYPDFAWQHPQEWCAFVTAVVKRYRHRLEAVEVWNEPNIPFWKPNPDAAQYAKFLKLTYECVKRVAPEIRVLMGGTAGLDRGFFAQLYAAGAADYMDVVNVHPYTHPSAPENGLIPYLEDVQKAIAANGGRQALWITEVGWPTHKPVLSNPSIIRAALETARPGRTCWNVVFADTCADGLPPNAKFAQAVEESLDGFVRIEACDAKQMRERLAAGGVDAVFFPFDESYPRDSMDAVVAFVERGGTLLQFGGFPMYRWVSYANGSRVAGADGSSEAAADRKRVGISYSCWWMNSAIPDETQVYPTEGAVAAGLKAEPTGFRCGRFFTSAHLKPGDEFVPLLVGKDKNGGDIAGAGVYRFNGEKGGRVAVCGLSYGAEGGVAATEAQQAMYYARMLGIVTAMGVERTFSYNLQAWEADPYYSEHHFGIVHRDFSPKPAYRAYATFTKMRPAGSVQKPGKWHDDARETFFPRWDLAGGRRGGMIWTVGAARIIRQTFSDAVEFFDLFGNPLKFVVDEKGGYAIPISDQPIYWRARK